MTKNRDKPTPINRDKFLNNIHEPYQIPEQELQPYDNSNPDAKFTNPGQPDFVRANEISLKDDNSKPIQISLEDHDATIIYYIKNNIKPTVEINGNQREVPIVYGSPERWKSIQKDGFYRDKNGKAQIPLIILKRESFEKDRTLGNKLDGNKVNNVKYFKQGYSRRNGYDNFSVLQNQKPSIEYKVGIIPDYITIRYKLIIYTDYVEHMNKLIEAMEFASDSYWGDKEKFMFRASIDSYPTPITVESGGDRASKSEMTLTVKGYIIPNTINVNMASPVGKSFNTTKVIINEVDNNPVASNIPAINYMYPIFYGVNNSKPIANQGLINSGIQLATNSMNAITINFNASGQYLWWAIPESSTNKTKWYVDIINNGNIGGISDLFNTNSIITINSPSNLWSEINYRVYISNYPTSITENMELRNS